MSEQSISKFLAAARVGIATEAKDQYGRIIDYDSTGVLFSMEVEDMPHEGTGHRLIWLPWRTILYIFHPQ